MTRKTITKRKRISSAKQTAVRGGALSGKTSFYGYDFVLLVDVNTGRSVQLGGAVHPAATLYRSPVHQAALQKTLKRGIYHYEWSTPDGKKRRLYQTTCVALLPADSAASGVLSFSRDITHHFVPYVYEAKVLQDGVAPRTFAQILLATRETEKKEISKALHDEIGSTAVMLTALLSLVRVGVQTGNTQQALRDLMQLDDQIKQSVERLKKVVVSLRPPSLENTGGLIGSIQDLLDNVSALNHIPYTFNHKGVDEQAGVSDQVKILLYRIVQEALTNIVKHSCAKHIRVCLKMVDTRIYLSVNDDGIGFTPEKQLSIKHIGLLAMKDSVELLGGKIAIKSAPGKGTRIEVSCPSVVYGGE